MLRSLVDVQALAYQSGLSGLASSQLILGVVCHIPSQMRKFDSFQVWGIVASAKDSGNPQRMKGSEVGR